MQIADSNQVKSSHFPLKLYNFLISLSLVEVTFTRLLEQHRLRLILNILKIRFTRFINYNTYEMRFTGRLIFPVSPSPRSQSFLSGFLHIPHLTCSTIFPPCLVISSYLASNFSFLPFLFSLPSLFNPFIILSLSSLLFRKHSLFIERRKRYYVLFASTSQFN